MTGFNRTQGTAVICGRQVQAVGTGFRFNTAEIVNPESSVSRTTPGTLPSYLLLAEGSPLKTDLSILLPVYNAEERLPYGVASLLDVAPELTHRFDVLIIDDGSTDDTPEVAAELARQYPQVSVVRHPARLGLAESIQTGLDNTDGEMVLVGDEQFGLDPEDLRQLWQLRREKDAVMARQAAIGQSNWIEKLLPWKGKRPAEPVRRAGLQVIRRSGLDQWRWLEQQSHRLDGPDANHGLQAPLGSTYRERIKRFVTGE